jgi:hypothetical protein
MFLLFTFFLKFCKYSFDLKSQGKEKMEYKRIDGLPEVKYHALSAVGSSTLKNMAVSPAYYKQNELANQSKKPSAALMIGSMFHELILESEKELSFACQPEGLDKRTKEGKAQWAQFNQECEVLGKTPMSKTDYDNTIAMAEAFKNTEACQRMFRGDVSTEVSIISNERKCRFDLLKETPAGFVAYDLKTTDDLPQNQKDWQRYFVKWRYDIQAAWYVNVASKADINVIAFNFVVISKKPPYDYAVVRLSEDFLENGLIDGEVAYQTYLRCIQENHWPGNFERSEEKCLKIEMPGWFKK